MQLNPYLFYGGNCEAALRFYEKVLGARIEAMLTYEGGPAGMPISPGWNNKVMHAKITIGGDVLMASDAPPGRFNPMQGCAVSLQVEDPAEAEQRFKALSEGGSSSMPFGKTFFSKGFGMCVDQFGVHWMVNCPLEE